MRAKKKPMHARRSAGGRIGMEGAHRRLEASHYVQERLSSAPAFMYGLRARFVALVKPI